MLQGRFQKGGLLLRLGLGALVAGDVDGDAAVAPEGPVRREDRLSARRQPQGRPVRPGDPDLEAPEGRAGQHGLDVIPPGRGGGVALEDSQAVRPITCSMGRRGVGRPPA